MAETPTTPVVPVADFTPAQQAAVDKIVRDRLARQAAKYDQLVDEITDDRDRWKKRALHNRVVIEELRTQQADLLDRLERTAK